MQLGALFLKFEISGLLFLSFNAFVVWAKVLKSARNTLKIATNVEGKLCSGRKILPRHRRRVNEEKNIEIVDYNSDEQELLAW